MKFPNAAKGIKRLFSAEILGLIATVAMSIFSILAIVTYAQVNAGNDTGIAVSGIGMLIFGAGAGVLAIIALIFRIIGVVQSSRDEESFRLAIYLTIACLIFAAIGGIFTNNSFLYNLFTAISNALSLVSSLMIILGIGNLAAQLHNNEVMARCGSQFRVILWIGIVALLARFFSIFMPSRAAFALVITLAILSAILSVAQYVLYLILLSKAKTMLEEN